VYGSVIWLALEELPTGLLACQVKGKHELDARANGRDFMNTYKKMIKM
jgi:hypothetical protein